MIRNQRLFNSYARNVVIGALLCLAGLTLPVNGQKIDNIDRDRGRLMLKTIKEDIKNNYYDSKFHGLDLEARFQQADEKLKQATSLGQIFGIIAQAVLDLNDTHTYFIPPGRAANYEYGWESQIIGNKCFIIAVRPGSDAEAKGLKRGDELITIDGVKPSRANYFTMIYLYNTLRPQPGVRLVVQSPTGEQRQLDIMTKIIPRNVVTDLQALSMESEKNDRIYRHRSVEVSSELFIWKMPQFDLDEFGVDKMMEKVKKHKSLILDLRGNGGGAEITLLRLLGHFFERDVKVGELKRRKESKPLLAKSRGDRAFEGDLVVIIDSESGSAAELFARVVQIEKRGVVIGDRSAGAVMRSRVYGHDAGNNLSSGGNFVIYGVAVTDGDLIMTDGNSLERVGVNPDETVVLTAADIAANRDPVLAHAAHLVRVKLDAEKAGSFFPYEWPKP
jgi:carboxyl-terminal processing protease